MGRIYVNRTRNKSVSKDFFEAPKSYQFRTVGYFFNFFFPSLRRPDRAGLNAALASGIFDGHAKNCEM